MMKFKKFLAAIMTGAMMFGVVATAAPVASVYAATTPSAYTIKVDYKGFRAIIFAETQATAYVTLEVLKDEAGTKPGTKYTYPVAELSLEEDEVFENMDGKYGVVVDLSFLKISKKAYIRAQGNGEEVPTGTTTIYPQFKKLSIKYTSGKADDKWYEAFTIDKTPLKAAPAEEVYEYRTLYGSEFSDLTTFASAKATAEVAGTTLIVRKAAKQADDDTAGVISAEVKVKVPAAPKAPKVAVDYVKNIVKLPKNTEYAVIKADGKTVSDFAFAGEKGASLSPTDILNNCDVKANGKADPAVLEIGFSIVVHTLASGKKANSLDTIVSIPGVVQPSDPTDVDSTTKKIAIGSDDKVYATLKKTDTGYDLTATGADFGYALDSADSTKWTTVKSGATKSINMTKDTDGKLYVKAMGNKTEGTLPTDAVEVSWFKITSIDVEVVQKTIKASATAEVTVNVKVNAIGDVKDDDKEVTAAVTGPSSDLTLTVSEGTGKIALKANTEAGEYTVTVTSDKDNTVKGTGTFTVEEADGN